MLDDISTPRARHWAMPMLAAIVMTVLAWRGLAPGSTLALICYAIALGMGFWWLINFLHHISHAASSILREWRELDFRLSENFFIDRVAGMNEAQLRAIRTGRHVLEVIPGEKGPIEKLWGVECYLFMAWYILTMSDDKHVYPINRFKEKTFHFDGMSTHEVDDYQQAKAFHSWLVIYGYARWGRGNESASWVHPHTPEKVLGYLGMDRNTYLTDE